MIKSRERKTVRRNYLIVFFNINKVKIIMKGNEYMKWDVFISHASEDKENFVQPFAEILSSYGVQVWFDKFTLKVGDSLTRSIDSGLINSRYGIVVLSKAFINKGWTDYELRSLLNREVGYNKVILPIWHEISKEDILNFSPYLADKFALSTSDLDINDVAMKIIEVVRPDIYQNYHRLKVFNNLKQDAIKEKIPTDSISIMPIIHEKLSLNLLVQIKVIQELFYDMLPLSFEDTVNDFKRDMNPEREVLVWQRIAATYLMFIKNKVLEFEFRKEIFFTLLNISFSSSEFNRNDFSELKYLNQEDVEKLYNLYNSIVPGVDSFDTEILVYYMSN